MGVGAVRGRDRESLSLAGTAGHPASLGSPYPCVFTLPLSPPLSHIRGKLSANESATEGPFYVQGRSDR